MFKTLTKHSPTRGKKDFEKILIRSQVIAEIPCTANIVSIDLLCFKSIFVISVPCLT